MYELIRSTEETMLEQIESQKVTSRDKQYFNEDKPSKRDKSSKRRKWCKFHKTNTHSDLECRAQGREHSNNQLKRKDNSSNVMMV